MEKGEWNKKIQKKFMKNFGYLRKKSYICFVTQMLVIDSAGKTVSTAINV